ncbi:hypothetical protein GX563_09010 [Candidatus Bathyarchaeota archaeon]|nr:hypothetical protein [Candidatus Bathyarchaeota archaeon]
MKKTIISLLFIALIICSSVFTLNLITVNAQTGTQDPTPTPTAIPESISAEAQFVVDSLESKGFDVTFVYFGSNKTYTRNYEDMAIVAMRSFEHAKNGQLTDTQKLQLQLGNDTLAKAFPNAELFRVSIFEDSDKDGFPDDLEYGYNYYETMYGGTFGGGSSSTVSKSSPYYSYLWNEANRFISTDGTTPTPNPTITPTPTPTPTSSPTANPTTQPTSNPTTNPTTNPTAQPANPTTNPTQAPTNNPTTAPTPSITSSPAPTPTVPELTAILLLPMLTLILFGAVAVKLKKQANEN